MSRRKKEISDETEKHAEDETVDEIPYFKEIWNKLDQYEEEYLPSNEIQKYHCNLQKNEINIDSQYLKLVNKFVKLKLQGNQSDEKDISRLARFYLKNEKENDEDELLLDEELGVFPTKCPISQMPFENPVTQRFSKNRKACVHTFEKAFILRLMHNKDTIECPIAACKKKVYKSSLHPDYEFLHHSRYKKFRDHITDALEYFNNIRNEEKEILDFAE